ncbi:SHOCT domain-containing protein [Haloarcula sp. Atlit-47R]|uniref:SHOCT domain-containing protein n=1 Tax=Haloarcula sp. Atlit-47R TaxID=2282132 RepID=UPI000EF1EC96|nr:SHOCT domain-containing protein [Haloarcula sp. Atlit-47R]RLM44580.1 SHOCT domain-containing protein [Haloarcula sp. Atlit-47R]
MNWVRDNRLLLLFAAVVLTTLGAVGLGIVGVVATVGALLGGGAVVQTVAGFLLGTLLLVGVDIVFSVALVRALARRASVPKSQRVADGLARLEAVVPPLASFSLSDVFAPPEPTVEERHEALTRRYVEGELSEAEYERELRTLLDEDEDPGREPQDAAGIETDLSRTTATDAEYEPARE